MSNAQRIVFALTFLVAFLAASMAFAAGPTLTAAPYPTTATQPDGMFITVNGGAPISGALPSSTAGKTPTVDMAFITAPGTYNIVMTVTKAAGCNAAGDECWPEGSASSAPFVYKWRASGAPAPTGLRVAP